MRFRLKAFAVHLGSSALVLALCLGILYLGWYRWPGWYLTGMFHVALILASVDVTLGPLITLLIANPKKPRRELARDISVIVVVQLIALFYGVHTLWHGRPLYYAFSGNQIETVQASAISPAEAAKARELNPGFAPHWYNTPRWVWTPMTEEARRAIASDYKDAGASENIDIINMPRFYKRWDDGLPELKQKLMLVDNMYQYTPAEKRNLKAQLSAQGFSPDQPISLFLTGAHLPLLVVFDPASGQIRTILRAD